MIYVFNMILACEKYVSSLFLLERRTCLKGMNMHSFFVELETFIFLLFFFLMKEIYSKSGAWVIDYNLLNFCDMAFFSAGMKNEFPRDARFIL